MLKTLGFQWFWQESAMHQLLCRLTGTRLLLPTFHSREPLNASAGIPKRTDILLLKDRKRKMAS